MAGVVQNPSCLRRERLKITRDWWLDRWLNTTARTEIKIIRDCKDYKWLERIGADWRDWKVWMWLELTESATVFQSVQWLDEVVEHTMFTPRSRGANWCPGLVCDFAMWPWPGRGAGCTAVLVVCGAALRNNSPFFTSFLSLFKVLARDRECFWGRGVGGLEQSMILHDFEKLLQFLMIFHHFPAVGVLFMIVLNITEDPADM
jgi:hypothetical protein